MHDKNDRKTSLETATSTSLYLHISKALSHGYKDAKTYRYHSRIQQLPLPIEEASWCLRTPLYDDSITLHSPGQIVPGTRHEREFSLESFLVG